MKKVQHVVAGLLALAVVLVSVVAGTYALHLATYHPSLFLPPPESERKGNVQMVRESKNFDGLKQICTYWAEFEDRNHAFTKYQLERFESVTRGVALLLGSLGVIFSAGLVYVYLFLRRIESTRPNAL